MKYPKRIGIVGGGLAGLAAGGLLARQGFEVKLFETNSRLGGCCSTTTIDEYTFNDGALYVVLPGLLDTIFTRVGLDRQARLPMRKITAASTTFLPDGSVVTIGDNLKVEVKRPGKPQYSTRIKEDLKRLMEKWEPVLDLFENDILLHPFSYQRLLLKGWRHLSKLQSNVASEIRACIGDEALQAALAGSLLFSGLPPEKTPAMSLIGLIALLREGYYLPEGGMGSIPAVLSCALLESGGKIFSNAKVNRILVEHGRVVGLDVEGQGQVAVDAVISTTSGMLTYGLLAPEDAPASMRQKVEKAPLSHKALCLQLGLANKIDAGSHSINYLPWIEQQGKIFQPKESEIQWPIFSVPTVTLPDLAPPGGSIVEMYPPIRQDLPVEAWDAALTEKVVEYAMDALQRRYTLDVAVKRVLTPRDYRKKMHLYQGAVYGLSPTARPSQQFQYQTPIPGLYQAGQTTYPGFGVVFSAMSGIYAAEKLVEAEMKDK
jgi:phytoene desaturase